MENHPRNAKGPQQSGNRPIKNGNYLPPQLFSPKSPGGFTSSIVYSLLSILINFVCIYLWGDKGMTPDFAGDDKYIVVVLAMLQVYFWTAIHVNLYQICRKFRSVFPTQKLGSYFFVQIVLVFVGLCLALILLLTFMAEQNRLLTEQSILVIAICFILLGITIFIFIVLVGSELTKLAHIKALSFCRTSGMILLIGIPLNIFFSILSSFSQLASVLSLLANTTVFISFIIILVNFKELSDDQFALPEDPFLY